MPAPALDVIALGNAIVDVICHTDDAFLDEHGLVKGTMTLVHPARAQELYASAGAGIEVSGGSAANTAAGVALLGGRAAFIGKVRDDRLGGVFAHDLRAVGVGFDTPPVEEGPPTASSLILVTPDAQRTMSTALGACVELGPADVDPVQIGAAQITYLEGYLWDRGPAKDAFRKAANAARDAGGKVAFTLSDPFCVERWRREFLDLIDRRVDILFANEAEIKSLYRTRDLDAAVDRVRNQCEVVFLTRSERGSIVLGDGESHTVPAEPVPRVVDTTGAGDLYAAGALYGLVTGADLPACGRLGSLCAAEVITHFGARPQSSLKNLAASQPV